MAERHLGPSQPPCTARTHVNTDVRCGSRRRHRSPREGAWIKTTDKISGCGPLPRGHKPEQSRRATDDFFGGMARLSELKNRHALVPLRKSLAIAAYYEGNVQEARGLETKGTVKRDLSRRGT